MRNKINLVSLFITLTIFFCPIVEAHSGGLDSNGGHHNRKTSEYHCHREPCFSQITTSITVDDSFSETKKESNEKGIPYNREDWKHWTDEDKDCQNTRAEVLKEESKIPVTFTTTKKCTVKQGKWLDPYTEKTWTNASSVEIDHVVPLKWAHDHGGANWSAEKKEEFANDIENLIPVGSQVNQQKGSNGPDEWLPPNKAFHCQYLQIWMEVTAEYDLYFYSDEVVDLAIPLASCQ